jgi:hypothetical protein
MRRLCVVLATALALVFSTAGCDDLPSSPNPDPAASPAESRVPGDYGQPLGRTPPGGAPLSPEDDGASTFSVPVFDIAATPPGGLLVAETVFPATTPSAGTSTTTVKELTRSGAADVAQITTTKGSPINGLASTGRRSFFATSGGLDQAVGAGLWHVTPGTARLVADIEAFEQQTDPDAFEGPQWKDQRCEATAGFSAGPQSNPYHLARLSGRTALVADGAGNTLLAASTNGAVDWVSILTPPVREDVAAAASDDPEDWRVLFPLNEDTNCFVQPVPTAVDVGPDGAYYVGELTGVTPANLGGTPSTGLSRVWRVDPGARNVTCPSAQCEVVLSGLTSVLDLAFGPDGALYVVEYDENGWFAATQLGNPAGGTVNRCDVDAGTCTPVESGLTLPGAIAVDKSGALWLLENNIGTPTVRRLDPDASPATRPASAPNGPPR